MSWNKINENVYFNSITNEVVDTKSLENQKTKLQNILDDLVINEIPKPEGIDYRVEQMIDEANQKMIGEKIHLEITLKNIDDKLNEIYGS